MTNNNYQLEICCYNLQSAIAAEESGASRIELCADPANGGTTPSFGTIKTVRDKVKIPVYVIIRPRGGDFLCSDDEFQIMLREIALCRQLDIDGVVAGILNPDGSVDKKRTAVLAEAAYPAGVTFHRAFDRCKDPFAALEDIIDAGCERILTSGQQHSAMAGKDLLKQLVSKAAERIIIMPGGGIRSNNLAELISYTGAEEFHSAASRIEGSQMHFENAAMNESLDHIVADAAEIRQMVDVLQRAPNLLL
ncbi:MAG: copper homeostasis protein CutC [Gemmatimonadaceae bacterium]|nr:copper homeostasis protein CutC [Chitinophagaceae bacterium]